MLQQADRQVRNGLIKSSAVAVLAAMVFAFFATQSLGRRLRRITEFAERVAAGDLSARIQEDSSDEIAHVATALDKTARKLEDGFRALENSRQTLETLLNSMQEPVIAVSGGWAGLVGQPAHGTPAAQRHSAGRTAGAVGARPGDFARRTARVWTRAT